MLQQILVKIEQETDFCILIDGDSGSGKTTLILAIVRELIKQDARGVSFIPQYPNIFSGSVEDNVKFFRSPVSDKKIRETLDMVGLQKVKQSFMLQSGGEPLSGGERQRLVLARAMLSPSTDLIIIDEGLSALDDNEAVRNFENVISRYRRVIFTSHGTLLKNFASETICIS